MRKFLTLLIVLICAYISTLAQTRTITGKVTDQQGAPVPFATVHIKGSKAGASADENGFYTIRAKAGDVLVVTSAGLKGQETTIDAASSIINISVSRKEAALQEVVVTALGVSKSRNRVAYAAQTISGADVSNNRTFDVAQSMSGKIAGAQISQSNTMGGSTNVIL